MTNRHRHRLWIVQEVFLAADLHLICGEFRYQFPPKELSSALLQFMLMVCGVPLYETSAAKVRIYTVLELLYNRLDYETFRLGACLSSHADRRCADPRDKVFGLLACIREEERIQVDYSLSTEQVFLKVAKVLWKPYKPGTVNIRDKGTVSFLNDLRGYMGLQKWEDRKFVELEDRADR
jgi:hypothetical protein